MQHFLEQEAVMAVIYALNLFKNRLLQCTLLGAAFEYLENTVGKEAGPNLLVGESHSDHPRLIF